MTERLHVKDPKMKTTKGRNTLHLDSAKACNESSEEQLPDFDSWALTAGILYYL